MRFAITIRTCRISKWWRVPDQKTVQIDVRDFGNGVSLQNRAQLFQPFFSTEITGTGLGLYLAHSFCEANQAQLTYVEQKQGACFRIECLQAVI